MSKIKATKIVSLIAAIATAATLALNQQYAEAVGVVAAALSSVNLGD